MAQLEFRLLGPPQVVHHGIALSNIRSEKALALLAYLLTESEIPQRREKLAGLLWPGYPEESARTSLRRALADLRQAIKTKQINPALFKVTRQTIQFDFDSDTWVDVIHFNNLTRNGFSSGPEEIKNWEKAVELYQGEFMDGFSLPDSPEYETWLLLNREHYRRRVLELLGQLTESMKERGEYERGLRYAWHRLELDPVRESAHRQVMQLLALNGQREQAIAQYQVCARALSAEIGVEPSTETQDLYNLILKEEWPVRTTGSPTSFDRQPRSIGECPFRGLSAFREKDAAFFFGREAYTQKLQEVIQACQGVTAILGPSGTGKTSVVYAGLIPGLRATGEWLMIDFRPGINPFQSLAAAILPHLEESLTETGRLVEASKLAGALVQSDIPLDRLVARVLERSPNAKNCMIFIDQFEELYTLCPPEIRQIFLDRLFDAVNIYRQMRGRRFVLLMTLRADFLGQLLAYRPFAEFLQDGALMMSPMSRNELRASIEQPAVVQGAAFESGLIERILDDVGDEPGKLPLLEFAMMLLWDRANSGWITHEGYESIGKVAGALAKYAEQVYSELSEEEQLAAQWVFLQLIRPGEGTDDTRRVATRAEIGEIKWPLVQHLADKRLVVTGRDATGQEIVEVVHEALIGSWERLSSWIDSNRAFRTWQEHLRGNIDQWYSSERNEGVLLRGAPLAEAEGWIANRGHELNLAEMEFILASRGLHLKRQKASERARRRVVYSLSLGLIITLILAVFAGIQSRSARQAQLLAETESDLTRKALSRSLASQAQLIMEDELDLASLLSIEAVQIDPSVEARGSLLATLTTYPHLISVLHGHQQEMLAAVFSADGRHLATGDAAGDILLWEITVTEGVPQAKIIHRLSDHAERITSLAFSPDGQLLASGSFDDTIDLWNVTTGQLFSPQLTGHTDNVNGLEFSPNGEHLVSIGADGQVLLWGVRVGSSQFGQIEKQLRSPGRKPISSLAISPDWPLLAYGLEDGSIILWDIDENMPRGNPLLEHQRNVRALAFSPDGQLLVSGSDDRRIIIWDTGLNSIHFGEPILGPLEGHRDWVTSLTFDPVNNYLTSTDKDGLALVWDLSYLESGWRISIHQRMIDGHSPLWNLDYAPNGEWLVTNGGGNSTILMDITRIHPLAQAQANSQNRIRDMTFSPDGRTLVTADDSGILNLWDSATGQPLNQPIKADPCCLRKILFSPDGLTLASTGSDDLIHLWDMNRDSKGFGQAISPALTGHLSDVTALAYHPKQPVLVTGGQRYIIFWNVDPDSNQFGTSIVKVEKPSSKETSMIYELAFNPEGDLLDSVYFGEVYVQDVSAFFKHSNDPQGAGEIAEMPHLFSLKYDAISSGRLHSEPIEFNSAHTTLVNASFNEITAWDLDPDSANSGKMIGTSIGTMDGRLNAIRISPDSNFLVSGDIHGMMQFWDLGSQRSFGPQISGPDVFIAFAFNPNGSILASGGVGGSIVLWELNLDGWITQACQRANRNLTQEEWHRFFGEEPYRATCTGL